MRAAAAGIGTVNARATWLARATRRRANSYLCAQKSRVATTLSVMNVVPNQNSPAPAITMSILSSMDLDAALQLNALPLADPAMADAPAMCYSFATVR